jgi:hypothetical protein
VVAGAAQRELEKEEVGAQFGKREEGLDEGEDVAEELEEVGDVGWSLWTMETLVDDWREVERRWMKV